MEELYNELEDLAYDNKGTLQVVYYAGTENYKVMWSANHLGIRAKQTDSNLIYCLRQVLKRIKQQLNK